MLGVPRTATEKEIKKAFKKLTIKYHPDKNLGNEDEAKEKFMNIANAYDILSDPEKREIYDQHGAEGVRQHQAQSNQG